MAATRLRPLAGDAARTLPGFWADRLRLNREVTLPSGAEQLDRAGTVDNFRSIIEGGPYRAGRDDAGFAFPFLDSDVYKWLEAAAWEVGRGPDAVLTAAADRMIDLVVSAQRDDGYLNSYVQLETPGGEFVDLQWGHELYCFGHLIQAAVAWHRTTGDDRLLGVGRRAADLLEREFGPAGRDGVDGHPEIEMALVELYRVTGERRYLDLAARFVGLRGHGLLGSGRYGAGYWQDHAPVRTAPTPTGHAVRQLYLDCGAVDVAVETGDAGLLAAVVARWEEMVASRTYLTGALGAHHRDEAFGDAFELPPDRAYAETCAAIASVMLSWRLLLATGRARYADLIERTLYNAVLPGLSLDGTGFFYVNPLQRRTRHEHRGPGAATAGRAGWFACACCPPNIMRTLASLEHYLATVDEDGVQLQQYASAELGAAVAAGDVRLRMQTGYPGAGTVTVEVTDAPAAPWTLSLRVPAWAGDPVGLTVNGEAQPARPAEGYLRVHRTWVPGDRVVLTVDLTAVVLRPDPRIDAVRGCAAVQRGPLVYCLEQVDLPPDTTVEDVALAEGALPRPRPVPGLPPDLPGLAVPLVASAAPVADWPYRPDVGPGPRREVEAVLVPYLAWANRSPGGMRVWLPTGR